MSSIEIDAVTLQRYLFIETLGGDQLKIQCNFCNREGHIFFEGEDTDTPDINWLEIAALHVKNNH